MFFTLVIPTYNSEQYIEPLLDSVIAQKMKDYIKVLIIDDSTEQHAKNYQEKVKKYNDKLNIEYFKRRQAEYTIHCPGNTRHDGLRRALEEDTEYICFADHDDEFIPETFEKVFSLLTEHKPEVLLTPFFEWDEETGKQTEIFNTNIGWLHGNFYQKQFLADYNIQFKIDLVSHEDVYFNTLVKCYLMKLHKDFTSTDLIVYKWYNRADSESHYIMSRTGKNFLEDHFNDYLESAILPTIEALKTCQDLEFLQGLQTFAISSLIMGYFYFQGFLFNGRLETQRTNYNYYRDIFLTVLDSFKIRKEHILATAYSNPAIYCNARQESIRSVGMFLEEETFQDFIMGIKINDYK